MFLLPYSLSFDFTELTSSIGRRIWLQRWKTTANLFPPSTGRQTRDHLCCIQYTKDCQEKIHFTGAERGGLELPRVSRRCSGSERTASPDRSDGEKHGIPKLNTLRPIHRCISLFERE